MRHLNTAINVALVFLSMALIAIMLSSCTSHDECTDEYECYYTYYNGEVCDYVGTYCDGHYH